MTYLKDHAGEAKIRSIHIQRRNKIAADRIGERSERGSGYQCKYRGWLKNKESKRPSSRSAPACCASFGRLKKDRPYVEPDAVVLENLERQKQVRHYAPKLSELGADEQTVRTLVESLLQPPAASV
jgi:hypothetical protein